MVEGKFRPTSAFNTGYNTMLTARGIANPRRARLDANEIAERVDSEPERVDSESKRVGVTRQATPAEVKRYNLSRGQQTFGMSTTGGLPDLTPEIKEPTRTMPEEQVKVLAPTASPSPTAQSNLNQFTERMVKVINQDDAEDAREEKSLNAKNIDGSPQKQGHV